MAYQGGHAAALSALSDTPSRRWLTRRARAHSDAGPDTPLEATMAQHPTPTDRQQPAPRPGRPLFSALTRWWHARQAAAPDTQLGYESALPWMLDDTPAETADARHR
jgi:hypothetical protein